MGQKLQTFFLTFLLSVSILLIGDGGRVSNAQVSLNSDAPLEIKFSQNTSEQNETSVTVDLADITSIFSSEFDLQAGQWQSYDDTNSPVNYYVSGGIYGTAPGRIQLENSPYQTFFVTSVENNSNFSFGNFIVAFDFIYNFFESENLYNYELKFKVNDGEWKSLPSAIIEKSSLRSIENSWSSFSVHLNINDVYVRPTDTIHFMWVINGEKSITDPIPLAIQRMEVFPERINQNLLERGDLIITELLPASSVNGSDFEYIEVYNPGELPISLKGIELITNKGSKIVQKDLIVDPYDFTVISNADISTLDGVNNSYFYTGSIIESNGGRIELERAGDLIASATYEPSEVGVALELDRASLAYDGYSSMQDFVASQSSYYQELFGSPGTQGNTSPMFKKTLNQRGVYLLSFPGKLLQRLNRNSSLEYYTLDGSELEIASIEPHVPVVVKKTDNNPITLFTEMESNLNTKPDLSSQFTPNSQFLSIKPGNENPVLNQRGKQNILQALPVTQVWEPQRNKFTLRLMDQVQTNYWSPLMIHSSVANLLETSENQVHSPLADRFIEFGVVPEGQEGSRLSDVVMVGFMDVPSQYDQIRYDLPKISLDLPTNSDVDKKSSQLLYLTSTLSSENFNSFTHVPFEIDQEYEFGLGYQMLDDAGGAILRWSLGDEIPDEWIIMLEDTFNGTIVNLKEENEYRFRYTTPAETENQKEIGSPRMSSITPQERPRFVVKVKPYESYMEVAEETEVPNNIELRPNYPNPFNPSTNINFYLPGERNVRVGIYNIVGQQVALLVDDVVQSGEHSVVWDASDKPSGIYIVQLETGNRIFTRKITLIK